MKKARVHHIFGTHGQVIQEGPHREERAYDICTHGVVFVTYRNSNNTVIAYQWVQGE